MTLAGTLEIECGANFAFLWEKCENHHQAHPSLHEHELERAKKRMNSVLCENLEGLMAGVNPGPVPVHRALPSTISTQHLLLHTDGHVNNNVQPTTQQLRDLD